MLRAWRMSRGKSQLALAMEAHISTRHLSFIETGRSSPSREMVLALAEQLGVPLRERNALLEAAGFAAVYRETPLEAPRMNEIRAALSHILEASEPNPTFAVNRRYDILLANEAAVRLVSFFAPDWRGKRNGALMLFSNEGLRPAIENFGEVAAHVVHRLCTELSALRARDPADDEMLAHAEAAHRELRGRPVRTTPAESILLPIRFRRGSHAVDLFTTITTLGTPLDITLQELRIETFFPVDARNRAALERVMKAASD
jgi:transcriptional regulator with XRE-family HTH domain